MTSKLKISFALALALVGTLGASFLTAQAETSWQSFGCENLAKKVRQSQVKDQARFDVIVYGGTPAGVAAAKSAADLGKKVLILSESGLFGGAISNGVGATDLGSLESNVGLAKRYLEDLNRFYRTQDYRSEPKVAECIFTSWLDTPRVTFGTNATLESVSLEKGMIKSITFQSGIVSNREITVSGKSFVDASYAGDLIYLSGASNRLGMADYYQYNETATASRTYQQMFQLKDPEEIAQAEQDFAQLPQVSITESKDNYSEQILKGMPSFTYRLCVTKDTDNLIPFSKAADYDKYAPAWRTFMKNYYGYRIQKSPVVKSNGTVLTQLWRIAKLPNQKFDLNAYYSSFTNLTMTKEYFEQPGTRSEVLSKYSNYLKSFLWFVQNDPSVPALEKNALAGFGLCADEFTSNGGWPQQPYLREGRRLVGKYTMTTKDILTNRTKVDAVAAASYPMDSKPTLFVFSEGTFLRDRSVMYRAPIYEIPLKAMLPKAGPKNLIVAVGISSSPAAYASIRMEPQFIQLGEAAGIAAGLASSKNGIISSKLLPSIKLTLKRVGGFAGLKKICSDLDMPARDHWGFDQFSCRPKPMGLIIAK